MAEVDIDPFDDHDKTDAQPDETGETIPLILGVVGGESLGNQNVDKKHCLAEPGRARKFSEKYKLKNCTNYYIIKHTKGWNLICTCSKLTKMRDYILRGNL